MPICLGLDNKTSKDFWSQNWVLRSPAEPCSGALQCDFLLLRLLTYYSYNCPTITLYAMQVSCSSVRNLQSYRVTKSKKLDFEWFYDLIRDPTWLDVIVGKQSCFYFVSLLYFCILCKFHAHPFRTCRVIGSQNPKKCNFLAFLR